uniref:Fusicoccadiene synthase n=1 Tax=Talaromyces marneffei PM1 TaxID=1077442 RepID=A0A093VXQ0_TALMA
MEYRYSERIDPKTYETHGLCDGIELRIHKDPHGEIKGALRCQHDWAKLVAPVNQPFWGTLGDPYSFIRVSIPETLPERLEILSYANEFAFIYDDAITEDIDQKLESTNRREILDEFGSSSFTLERQKDTANRHQQDAALRREGVKQIQGQIFKEMLAIDKERAMTTMKNWQKFIQVQSSRKRSEPFSGLDEYLPCSSFDTKRFWFGMITFGMGLTIPDHEMSLCKELDRPAWEALALTNDLYSWEKERDDAAKAGESLVVNAIWVLMEEYSLTEPEAKDLCRQRIKESVSRAVKIAADTKKRMDLSLDLRQYTDAITYSVSGNLVWSIYCPRYNPEEVERNNIFLSHYIRNESLDQQDPLNQQPQNNDANPKSYNHIGSKYPSSASSSPSSFHVRQKSDLVNVAVGGEPLR